VRLPRVLTSKRTPLRHILPGRCAISILKVKEFFGSFKENFIKMMLLLSEASLDLFVELLEQLLLLGERLDILVVASHFNIIVWVLGFDQVLD